jgi:hypothetical protein
MSTDLSYPHLRALVRGSRRAKPLPVNVGGRLSYPSVTSDVKGLLLLVWWDLRSELHGGSGSSSDGDGCQGGGSGLLQRP